LFGRNAVVTPGTISHNTGDRLTAIAASGLLAMLTDSLMPFAFTRIREEARQRHLLSEQELEEVLALLEDPTVAFGSPIMFSAWGRRPAH
jgi:hypothetical protein